jgi:hypothetical protein
LISLGLLENTEESLKANIYPLQEKDLESLKEFTDREIGHGYYSVKELEEIFQKSSRNGVMTSFLLKDDEGIQGVRFTYPPGRWTHGKGQGLNPQLWPHSSEDTAYFQSLFLSAKMQGSGWGVRLSIRSIEALKSLGARGIVCHSWKESPNNSSSKYLQKLGFEMIAEHLKYWQFVDYNCTRCKKPPCQCTAIEMYLDLEKFNSNRENL